MRPASASAKRTVSSSACERRSSAQTCRPGTRLTMSRAIEREVARAAVVAGHEHEHALGARGPELRDEDLVVLRRAGPGAPGIVVTVSAAAAGPASRTARTSGDQSGAHGGATYHGGRGGPDRIRPAKDMAGEPLLRGVSFKLERRERMTIAGRNGAGKTTLLRMLVGRDVDRRRRAGAGQGHAHGAARPAPAARARPQPARLRALAAAREPLELEAELAAPRARDGRRRRDGDEPLRRRARRASRPPAATAGASARARSSTAWASSTTTSTAPLRDVLRRPAHARVAGPRARRRARPAAARRADQPPRHRVAGVARADAARASTPPSCSSPTTAGSWRPSAPRCSSSRPAARASSTARGTRGARSRPRASWRSGARSRSSRPRSRAWSASSSASAPRRPRRARRRIALKKLDKIERIERDPRDGRGAGVRSSRSPSARGG